MNDMDNMTANSDVQRLDFNTPALQRKRRIRALKDHLARWYVSIGGLAVLGAITLIFFYLAQVVLPMFQGAELEARKAQQPAWLADAGKPLLLAIEEQNQVALRLGEDGQARFFSLRDGALLTSKPLPLPEGSRIVSVGQDTPGTRRLVLGLDNGQALVLEHNYKVTYPNNQKTITPELAYPFGEAPLELDPEGRPIERAAISLNGKTLLVAGATGSALHAQRIASSENLLTGEVTLEQERLSLPQLAEPIRQLLIDPRHMWLYAISGKASADVFDLRRKQLNGRYKLVGDGSEITSVSPLLGGISLMVGDSRGSIGQWFMVRAADGQAELKNVRNFKLGSSPVRQILPEERRKGFLALDAAAVSASSTAPHTARCSRSRSPMAPRWRPCRRAPHVCCWSRRRGCSASSSTTRTRRFPGARCGARSGTRAIRSPITSGSPPPPTAISNPS